MFMMSPTVLLSEEVTKPLTDILTPPAMVHYLGVLVMPHLGGRGGQGQICRNLITRTVPEYPNFLSQLPVFPIPAAQILLISQIQGGGDDRLSAPFQHP